MFEKEIMVRNFSAIFFLFFIKLLPLLPQIC